MGAANTVCWGKLLLSSAAIIFFFREEEILIPEEREKDGRKTKYPFLRPSASGREERNALFGCVP